jgi:hypothetical protein
MAVRREARLQPCPSARPGVQTEEWLRGEPAAGLSPYDPSRPRLARSWAEAAPKCAGGRAPSHHSASARFKRRLQGACAQKAPHGGTRRRATGGAKRPKRRTRRSRVSGGTEHARWPLSLLGGAAGTSPHERVGGDIWLRRRGRFPLRQPDWQCSSISGSPHKQTFRRLRQSNIQAVEESEPSQAISSTSLRPGKPTSGDLNCPPLRDHNIGGQPISRSAGV